MSRDALIVGINSYNSPILSYLQAPAEDAEAIALLLEKYGEFDLIRRLPEAISKETQRPYVGKKIEVSYTQLEDELVKLFQAEGKNIPDTALFYFSGHGVRKTKGIQEGFLATSDVNPKVGFNGLSLQWLRRLLAESPIKQQIIWLDCCHSGELLNFEEANPGGQGKARDRCFIAASREFESAYEELGSKYSVLTKLLRKGLNPERCPQRWVTNISLTDYLNQHLQGAIQTSLFTNSGEPIKLTRSWEVKEEKVEIATDNQFCPYKGLQYFDYGNEDYKYFYGREKLTDELLDKIQQTNFIGVLGASGSGKSSVIRAGLLHQLKEGRKLSNSSNWEIHILLPGENPMNSLALTFLNPDLPKLERARKLGEAKGLLDEGSDGLQLLVESSDASAMVIFVDQFEEVFTLCEDKVEREKFFECLLGGVEKAKGKLYVIIGMRIDFFGKCFEHEYSNLGKKIQDNLVAVSPMSKQQLKRAITKPAHKVNLKIEESLIEEMLRDIEGAPASLPLLQYTLTRLWQEKTDNSLKLLTYSKLGRIAGTLDKKATEVFNSFNGQQQETAKHIFLCLTQLGENTEDTRRRILKSDLITAKHSESSINEIVQKLADEKLIVTNESPPSQGGLGGLRDSQRVAVIDVAHEALIRHWHKLREWLNENRTYLLTQRKLNTDAQNWHNSGRKKDYLLQGFRLKEAIKFQKDWQEEFPLSTLTEELIKKSIRQKRINLVKFLIIPIMGMTTIGFFAYREIQIQIAWDTLHQSQQDEIPARRNEALETLDFWQALERANLQEMNLSDITLPNANLKSAYLKSAYLNYANLNYANLNYANLYYANLYYAYLKSAYLKSAYLKSAYLKSAYLNYAYLNYANLNYAYLKSAYLKSANLNSANLNYANLNYAYLNYANLKSANLESANLKSAYLNYAYLINAKNLTPSQLKLACFWDKAFYKGEFDKEKLQWIINEEANQKYINELKQDESSNPKVKPDCSRWWKKYNT